MKRVWTLLAVAQALLALPVFARMVRTANGRRVRRTEAAPPGARVTVLVPVLNENHRLAPCLDGLVAQGHAVAEILVIDGGSHDGTQDLVRRYAERDQRVRLLDATPVPPDRNGKAHGLLIGLEQSDPATDWVLTIDADVRPDPALVRSLLAHASAEQLPVMSAATRQRLSGAAEGLLHPAMLTTLVYRFGIPGHATFRPARVQANGQCMLVRRDVLVEIGGFAGGLDSVCEDITLARTIASTGRAVGFYETDGLVSVEMYETWRDTWQNWTRSLPMRDRFTRRADPGLAEVLLVQALPFWLTPLLARRLGSGHPVTLVNTGLVCARVGVLAGTARAYERRPWTYWLSPLADLPVALRLIVMARRRVHTWRGRRVVAGGTA